MGKQPRNAMARERWRDLPVLIGLSLIEPALICSCLAETELLNKASPFGEVFLLSFKQPLVSNQQVESKGIGNLLLPHR